MPDIVHLARVSVAMEAVLRRKPSVAALGASSNISVICVLVHVTLFLIDCA
jgi:hypothetical protein